ncbi:hypothetical protein GDO81_008432 [Engystomops pustulosus]|uniref:Uncharacterized protein n=1 Tax=Engystomops pustulosus TaxID=76066 RepID=A0AAV7CEU2_ENGPU|nr:hypothetical protein GDO81_008432 [Engystomops pustulosus]
MWKFKEFRKVLDGLTAVSSSSSSSASSQPGNREVDIPETLQSEHFQLCKTVRHGFPFEPSAMAFDPVQKILAIGTNHGALRLVHPRVKLVICRYRRAAEMEELTL